MLVIVHTAKRVCRSPRALVLLDAPALTTTLSTHGHSTPAILGVSSIGTIYLHALLNGRTKVVHTESIPYIMRVNRKLKASNSDISAQLDSKLGFKNLVR